MASAQTIKEQLPLVVSCQHMMNEIHRNPATVFVGTSLENVQHILEEVQAIGQRALAPMFEREQRLEHIRAALVLIQQHQGFFGIPKAMRELIQRRDFPRVAQEYRRARFFLEKTRGVAAFRAVHEEVQQLADGVVAALLAQLGGQGVRSQNELDGLLALLRDLDCGFRPALRAVDLRLDAACQLLAAEEARFTDRTSAEDADRPKAALAFVRGLTRVLGQCMVEFWSLIGRAVLHDGKHDDGMAPNIVQHTERRLGECVEDFSQRALRGLAVVEGWGTGALWGEAVHHVLQLADLAQRQQLPECVADPLLAFADRLRNDFVAKCSAMIAAEIFQLGATANWNQRVLWLSTGKCRGSSLLHGFVALVRTFISLWVDKAHIGDDHVQAVFEHFAQGFLQFLDVAVHLAHGAPLRDAELLVLLGDLVALRDTALPSLLHEFERAFSVYDQLPSAGTGGSLGSPERPSATSLQRAMHRLSQKRRSGLQAAAAGSPRHLAATPAHLRHVKELASAAVHVVADAYLARCLGPITALITDKAFCRPNVAPEFVVDDPSNLRPHVFELATLLGEVYADVELHVGRGSLERRLMHALAEAVAGVYLTGIDGADWAAGGAARNASLLVEAEVAFVQQLLAAFQPSPALFQQCQQTLQRKYAPASPDEATRRGMAKNKMLMVALAKCALITDGWKHEP